MAKRARKKKAGRPALPESEKRMPLGIPVSPSERSELKAAADAAGLPLTTFARQVLMQHVRG